MIVILRFIIKTFLHRIIFNYHYFYNISLKIEIKMLKKNIMSNHCLIIKHILSYNCSILSYNKKQNSLKLKTDFSVNSRLFVGPLVYLNSMDNLKKWFSKCTKYSIWHQKSPMVFICLTSTNNRVHRHEKQNEYLKKDIHIFFSQNLNGISICHTTYCIISNLMISCFKVFFCWCLNILSS